MNNLLELAERCEKASGPNLELDALIWCATFAPPSAYVEQSKFNMAWCIYDGVSARSGQPRLWESSNSYARHVTGSVDAAMMLVPHGWSWRLDQGRNAGAAMYRDGYPQRFALADTPALALCAAALRALADRDAADGEVK